MSTICEKYPGIAACVDPETYAGADSFFGGSPPLGVGIGYLVVLGFGLLFSAFTTALVFLDKYYGGGGSMTSEHFK